MATEKKKKKDKLLQPATKSGRHINPMLLFLRIVVLPFVWLLYPYKLFGYTKVEDGACIFVSNHYRIWDVVHPASTTIEGIHYVAKSELKKSFISPFCSAIKMIYVDRNEKDVKPLMDMMKCLKNNEKICIYPEGTRNKTKEDMLPFHSGAAMLSIKTKTPIVPIVIYKKPMPFRMNHVLVGSPFEFKEYYGKKLTPELIKEADDKLRDRMIDMRREHTAWIAAHENY